MPSELPLSDPGYTPGRDALAQVLALLSDSDEETTKLAERALIRAGLPAALLAIKQLPGATAATRCRLYRVVGRVVQNQPLEELLQALVGSLDDGAAEVQRAGIVCLGKLSRELLQPLAVESRLVSLLETAAGPERRALIETLGKIGGEAAAKALKPLAGESDFERQLLDKSRLCLARYDEVVSDLDHVHFDVPLGEPLTVSLSFRQGLGRIVADQLRPALRAEPDGPTRLRVRHFRGALGDCMIARSVLAPAIELPLDTHQSEEELLRNVVDLLTCDRIIRLLERLSSAKPRLRFSVVGEGHRRAFIWTLSERIAAATSRLSANPKSALWEVKLDLTHGPRLFLEPRRYFDPRFTYRAADVNGASHPTIAAALAHVLGVRDNDVIWDPFVGGGLELIERARLGPYEELIGTDVDPAALAAAERNVAAAKLSRVRLLPVDARTACPTNLTGIVTNPPLGARHVRDGSLSELLLEFLTNARRWLMPGGRLVWLSPMPTRTADHAKSLGFAVERGGPVDVSGLTPELQVFRVPLTASRERWRS